MVRDENCIAVLEKWDSKNGQHILLIHSEHEEIARFPTRLPDIPRPRKKGRFTIVSNTFDPSGGVLECRGGLFYGNNSIQNVLKIT